MRLINADALWEIFREEQNSLTARCGGYLFLDDEDRAEYNRLEITLAYIENAPEVDAVPVVRGEWKLDSNDDDLGMSYWCSACNFHLSDDLFYSGYKNGRWIENGVFKYCPNCGAKMEANRDELL
jgi:hypothetical protein